MRKGESSEDLRKKRTHLETLASCYRIQDMIPRDKSELLYYIQAIAIIAAVSYLFYNSFISGIFLCVLIPIYVMIRKKENLSKKMNRKTMEFGDGMQAVSFALNTGYSIENAFAEAVEELELLYGKDSSIVMEFRMIVNRIRRNENLEDVMEDYAQQMDIDDITYFAEIFRYAKRSGGDIPAIIKQTVKIIREKAEVQNEIDTIISGRKMEQRVMVYIPLGILMYLRLTSDSMVSMLYGNIIGIIVMTLCLIVYVAAVLISRKIVDIKI